MSYHIYTTKGLVLGSWPTREADRTYAILTRDLGLVHATAVGVRKEGSKLRGHLEPFTLSTVSLVRGQNVWRITGASLIEHLHHNKHALSIFEKVFSLIRKLVAGEEKHPELFDVVESAFSSGNVDDEKFEISLVSQILFHLGYLRQEDMKLERTALIKAINNGIQLSSLA